ncbi:MAG: tetratricopeptide repeat protein [Deltaproteobacteria bacterium]|jgi:Tfp pilus assembly protein PilF
MDKTSSGELAGIGDLLGRTWQIYKERMWTLMAVGVAAVLLPILSLAVCLGLGYVVWQAMPDFKAVILVVSMLLALVGAVWLGNWGMSAFLTAIADGECGIKEAFRQARPKILAHVWLGVLSGLIVTGAHLLLVIPGVIFAVWFFFAPFVFIDEDVRGMNALLKSKAYVRGRWFGVCVRLVAIWFVSVLVASIPIAGQLLALFLIPFSFIYTFLLYKDLKALVGNMALEPATKAKIGVLATGTVGYVLPVVIVFVFMGSMLFMPFSLLKAKVTGESPFPLVSDGSFNPGPVVPITPVASMRSDPGMEPHSRADMGTPGKASQEKVATFQDGKAVLAKDLAKPAPGALKRPGGSEGEKTLATEVAGTEVDRSKTEKATERQSGVVALSQDTKAAGKLRPEDIQKHKTEVEKYTKAIQANPKDVLAYHNRAVAYCRLGSHGQAVDDFTNAIKLDPKNAILYYNRAIAYGALGKPEQAIDDGTKAIALNTKDANAYINRGIDYIALGDGDRAVKDLNRAIEFNAQDASAYYARGVAYYRIESKELALKDFKKAAQMGYKPAGQFLKSQGAVAIASR